ncbi:hypothetical protein TIFTF001_035725 [Ficus carica]|uniref:Uncharacterized protein n=1 Tax=Ficus carica TaxID=3494 RepID=A0AA88E2Z3_FICCA|nr:hypothetical protein TIFTF001_035725 [Ficus carica]
MKASKLSCVVPTFHKGRFNPWLCAMVSNLPDILDARLWRDDIADYEIWVVTPPPSPPSLSSTRAGADGGGGALPTPPPLQDPILDAGNRKTVSLSLPLIPSLPPTYLTSDAGDQETITLSLSLSPSFPPNKSDAGHPTPRFDTRTNAKNSLSFALPFTDPTPEAVSLPREFLPLPSLSPPSLSLPSATPRPVSLPRCWTAPPPPLPLDRRHLRRSLV